MSMLRPHPLVPARRLTWAQVELEAALLAARRDRLVPSDLVARLATALGEKLGVPCAITAGEPRLASLTELTELLPAKVCAAVLAVAPTGTSLAIAVEPRLALVAIEYLLGGRGLLVGARQELTAVEEGVLSYLALELLGAARGDAPGPLALGLRGIVHGAADAAVALGSGPSVLVVPFALRLGSACGEAWVVAPVRLLTSPRAASAMREGWRAALLEGVGRMPMVGRVELQELWDLTSRQLRGVEAGDVVVLGPNPLSFDGHALAGEVLVRFGAGRAGALRCRLCTQDSRRLELLEVLSRPTPEGLMLEAAPTPRVRSEASLEAGSAPHSSSTRGEAPPDACSRVSTHARTEALLEDVPAPVAVELGRLTLTAAQVLALEPGRILRFGRAAADPVGLSVHGHLLARGELVEVDGALGVRVTEIIGGQP